MSARIHRSKAPLPRAKRPAQRQREALEERGQLALDLSRHSAAKAAQPGQVAQPETKSRLSHKSTATRGRSHPTPADCARGPWRAFE